MLDVNILSRYWVRSEYHSYTYNYYINCTLFPWLEVAYTCTLVKGIHGSSYWYQQTWGQLYQSGQIVSFPVEGMERRLVEGLDASGSDWCE